MAKFFGEKRRIESLTNVFAKVRHACDNDHIDLTFVIINAFNSFRHKRANIRIRARIKFFTITMSLLMREVSILPMLYVYNIDSSLSFEAKSEMGFVISLKTHLSRLHEYRALVNATVSVCRIDSLELSRDTWCEKIITAASEIIITLC